MMRSMTAFATRTDSAAGSTLVWELRSVNHRYLEPTFKLPDALRAIEPLLRDKLRNQLGRGKIDCLLRLQAVNSGAGKLDINHTLLAQLVNTAEAIGAQLRDRAPLDALALLQWPGVLEGQDQDAGQLAERALALFQLSLEELITVREREGAALGDYIAQRLDAVADIAAAVRHQLPAILDGQRQRLQEKLADLLSQLDSGRIEQEVVLLCQKADVDEELDRLDAHIAEVRRVLREGGNCGRRLDFLMQELNREANTLSSKSIVSDTTQAAVELKVLIEQMREQIQNIE